MKSKMIRTGIIAGLVAALGVTAAVAVGASASSGSGTSTTETTTDSGNGNGNGHRAGFIASLTDEQRQCLTDAGVTKPEGKPTAKQKAAIKAAAESCGITLPARPNGAGHGPLANLTDEQRQCLTDAGVTKPEGKPTAEEKAAIKAAAVACGITLPAAPQG